MERVSPSNAYDASVTGHMIRRDKLKGLCVRTQLYLLATGRTCETRQILTQLERINTQPCSTLKVCQNDCLCLYKARSSSPQKYKHKNKTVRQSCSVHKSSLNIALTDISRKRRLMSMFLSKTSSLKIKLLMLIVMLASR